MLLVMGRYAWIWAVPMVAYGFAWTGHFVIEKNRPATFRHPLFSLIGDHKMAWFMVTGQIEGEYERFGIPQKG